MKCVMRMVMASLLLAACGGDDDGGSPDRTVIEVPDADTTLPDAPVGGNPDAPGPHVCLTEADYGIATLVSPGAISGGAGGASDPDAVQFTAALNGDATPDLFELELYKGYAAFSMSPIAPGTYQITGEELNYASCGVCPRIFTDYDPATMMNADQQYFATGGTVIIDSITPNFTGSVSNLTFEEVTVNPTTFMSTPVPGGCQTAVMGTTFDVPNMFM
jgi:hypothetical protein